MSPILYSPFSITASSVVYGTVNVVVVSDIGEKEGFKSFARLFVRLTCSEPSIFIM